VVKQFGNRHFYLLFFNFARKLYPKVNPSPTQDCLVIIKVTANPPVSVCPVPPEQRPINEYQSLRESWFFRWATLNLRGYLIGIAWIWSLSLLLTGPVAAASFAPSEYPGKFMLAAAAGASLLLGLTLLRLYLGWSYVRDRLRSEAVFYEETGWYDGQLWQKPPEEKAKDHLVVTYQVQPILQRLRWTFGVMALFLSGGCLAWNFL